MMLKRSDLLIFILLFIFVAAFPVDLIKVDLMYQLLIQIGLRCLLLTFYIYLIIKNKIKIFGVASWRHILMCLPFLLATVSNIIASSIDGGFTMVSLSPTLVGLYSLLIFLIAVSEEIVFRLFIHNSLSNTSSLKRIFGSAGIFALMHLLNLVNVSTVGALVSVLVQTVYTFGLGLLLGFLYEYGHSLTSCVVLHFTFNMLNRVIYNYVLGGYSSNIAFYLTAVVIGAILGVYVFILYKLYLSKLDRYFRA